jgi:hypothetical protein
MWPEAEEEARPVAAAAVPVVVDAAVVATAIEIADAAPPEEEKQETGDGQRATGDGQAKKRPRVVEAEPPPPRVAIDAAPVEKAETVVEPAADAVLTVAMDTWCDLTIDGEAKGRAANAKTVTVKAGRHAIACKNPRLVETWTQTVELAAGEKKTVKGTLVPGIAVLVQVAHGNEVLIDKKPVQNGATRTIKRGSHRVEVRRMGKVVDSAWVTMTRACTLVDRPAIACR